MTLDKTILITGGAGFIGSHVVRRFVKEYPNYHIINLDKLTYCGDLENIKEIAHSENYTFIKGDICDNELLKNIFEEYTPNSVIHLAAESHVDNSIDNPNIFIQTNVIGTCNLLNMANKYGVERFYHVSTDEVYGALGMDDAPFIETTSYDPKSPYSASKAASDHFVRAYGNTFKLNYVISNCSNNYGPNQHTEKLIPKVISSILNKEPIPVYGKGDNIRDWLYVEDHAKAIDLIFHNGVSGETYNIGGDCERSNLDLVRILCNEIDFLLNNEDSSTELITFVEDRKGHDFRYSIDCEKVKKELGWEIDTSFGEGIRKTIEWYMKKLKQ
jgi:dTDP-glucose 4,6-dehydratase|tara:strand:+ start:11059 stop:12045 length:987 start_codon:yes stop_codon:yes gene_type:complete